MKITINNFNQYGAKRSWSIEADSIAEAQQAVAYLKSIDSELNPIATAAEAIEEIIDNDEATTGTQALAALEAAKAVAEVKTPKETTRARARRKTTARTETVVDAAQIEIEPAAKVVDLMDALKQSLAVAPAKVAPVVVTEDAVFEAVKALAARKGVPAVHTVFAGFAIKKAGEISVEKRGELIAALVQAGSESAK